MSAELKDTVRDFLNNHRKAVFATVDDEGKPHTSLMLYVADDDFNVYFGTKKAFKKYEQLVAHPHISLSVIQEVVDPLMVADIRGKAEALEDDEMQKAFEYFKSKNPSKYYVEDADDYVMFKITPNMVRWLDATSGELSITNVEL